MPSVSWLSARRGVAVAEATAGVIVFIRAPPSAAWLGPTIPSPPRARLRQAGDGRGPAPRQWTADQPWTTTVFGTNLRYEEVADRRGDLCRVRFQREVPRIEEAHDRTRKIALERLGAGRQKEWIVLAPHRQQRRPVGAEVVVKLRIQRDIAGVVEEQVELDLVVARPSEQRRIERIALGRDQRLVGHAVHVLPPGGLGRQELPKRRAVVGRGLLPVAL